VLLPASSAAGIEARHVSDPASLVNPFIGTTSGGNTFPGADAPFGMVQWSPDTTSRPDGGGYNYNDSAITGFSLTHLSGPGCSAEGDVPILPTTGAIDDTATDSFSHAHESADAGNYKVTLANGVTTDLTATTRTGLAQFVPGHDPGQPDLQAGRQSERRLGDQLPRGQRHPGDRLGHLRELLPFGQQVHGPLRHAIHSALYQRRFVFPVRNKERCPRPVDARHG
jgi:hypothetical protein